MPSSSSFIADQATDWLNRIGFRFDPFAYLEASADPFLGDYLVGHGTFAVAWDQAPALIFAPAGGGKTSMRIYANLTCWTSFGARHPFPIVHQPNLAAYQPFPGSAADHLNALVRSGAVGLLLGLAYLPERLLALDFKRRRMAAHFLSQALPGNLSHYLSILDETRSPRELALHLQPSFPQLDTPSAERVGILCRALEEIQSAPAAKSSVESSAERRFATMVELLVGELGYRSIFLLVDGVDALPETAENYQAAGSWLQPLLEAITAWNAAGIYLKGFLPAELEPVLRPMCSHVAHCVTLHWDPPSLAEVIRRRVYVASEGAFGSLDAVSSPALRDVETILARTVRPLPRELIRLVRQLLVHAGARADSDALRIESEDIDAVQQWYAAQAPAGAARHVGPVIAEEMY